MMHLLFLLYLLIGSIYMLRNLYINTHSSYKSTYNKLSIEWKIMSMVVDMCVWPVVIINAIYRQHKKGDRK